MYQSYFDLKDKPFGLTPNLKYLFLTKQYESSLDTLQYAIREHLGFAVLTGEVGTGKTTITRALLEKLDKNVETALLVNPLLSVPELLEAINKDFGISTKETSPQKQIDILNKFLLKKAEEGKNALVIIDEAQNLSIEALEMVRMLTNIETDKAKLIQIVLAGQPELIKKLAKHELRQLSQRIIVRCHLRPLHFVEMVRYINHRIVLAGGNQKIYFEPGAYKEIWRVTKGLPRLINIVCDRSLTAAYVEDTGTISRKIVKTAVKDLSGLTSRPVWFGQRIAAKIASLVSRA